MSVQSEWQTRTITRRDLNRLYQWMEATETSLPLYWMAEICVEFDDDALEWARVDLPEGDWAQYDAAMASVAEWERGQA